MLDRRYTTDLYFECHLTFKPVGENRLQVMRDLVTPFTFRIASLVMMKTGEQHREDAFMTARSNDYADMERKLVGCVKALRANGFELLRYKIENTLMDSKFSDDLELLS